jgi:hypothetical protein
LTWRAENIVRVVTILLVALLALPATAFAVDRFTDPRGDADGGGPDIAAVTLSHTDTVLTIAVDFASAPPLGYDEREQYTDMLLIGIHTDDNLSQDDVEFATGVHGVDLTRGLVVSLGPDHRIVGRAGVTVDGTTVTLKLERAILEDPDEIAVQVAAGREYVDQEAGAGEGDVAPASGPHRYVLTGDGASWLWPLVGSGVAATVALAVFAVLRTKRSARRRPLGAAD